MPSTKDTVATSIDLVVRSQDLCANSNEVQEQNGPPAEDSRMLFRDYEQRPASPPGPPEAATPVQEHETKPVKRNKLIFKNRWLISVDVVAALRRAGVNCDIVLPPLYVDTPGLTRH